MTGLFITFEGTEGCGKSTQIDRLATRLRQEDKVTLQTREPGGTSLGEAIRGLLQNDVTGGEMTAEAELLLFAASRAQLIHESILPALSRGEVVLCDRFMDSTTVYQGIARQIDANAVAFINQFAVGRARPDLTILIDLPPEIGMARVHARGAPDRIEQEAIGFFEAVRAGYLQLAESEPERFLVFDGCLSIDLLHQQIWRAVQGRLT